MSKLIQLTILALLIQPSLAFSQVKFIETSAARGVVTFDPLAGFGNGVAAADFDGDGDIDFFMPQDFGVPNCLYVNDGNGNFTDEAPSVGLDSLDATRVATFFDYDNDKRLDLIMADELQISLYHQEEDGTFTDRSVESGLRDVVEDGGHRCTLSVGDLDNDGDMDVVTGLWDGTYSILINEDGTFVDISEEAGVIVPLDDPWQTIIHDFNRDGWMDLYSAVDFTENHLWINQQDGTFVDFAPLAGVDNAFNDMGVTISDYDNDGDFDIYITNIFETGPPYYNVLYRNESTESELIFDEVARESFVDNTGFGWGTTFLDANNDGFLDLAATNGWFSGVGYFDKSRLFLNDGQPKPRFKNASSISGFDDDYWGSSLIAADIDRDGDLDMLQTTNMDGPFRIMENRLLNSGSGKANWISVQPRQAGMNHWAIGAEVRIESNGQLMSRLITAGTSFLGQEPAEAFFGLGDSQVVDRVSIRWPFGDESVWENVAANQVIKLLDADLNRDGKVCQNDLAVIVKILGPCGNDCAADLNHDGMVTIQDAIILLSAIDCK